MAVDGEYSLSPEYFVPGALVALVNALATILFNRSVSISPLSETIPFLAVSPAVASFLGLFLGETLAPRNWFGIVLVIGGALLISPGNGESQKRNILQRRVDALRQNSGGLLMLLVGVCWGSTVFFDKAALLYAPKPIHAVIGTSLSSLLVVFIYLRRRTQGLEAPFRLSPSVLLLVLTAASAYGFQIVSVQSFSVGPFEAIKRGVGILSSLFVGLTFFREQITPSKGLAATLLAIGVSCIVIE